MRNIVDYNSLFTVRTESTQERVVVVVKYNIYFQDPSLQLSLKLHDCVLH